MIAIKLTLTLDELEHLRLLVNAAKMDTIAGIDTYAVKTERLVAVRALLDRHGYTTSNVLLGRRRREQLGMR